MHSCYEVCSIWWVNHFASRYFASRWRDRGWVVRGPVIHLLTLLRLELIQNCCLQELNPHHARRNKDSLIVPVVPEQVTLIAPLAERPQVLASLQHSVLADWSN